MKTLNAFILVCVPLFLYAQNDNYCPCQESKSDHEILFDWSMSLQNENKPINLPPQLFAPPPSIMQEPVIVQVSVPIELKEAKVDKDPESDIDESRINVAPVRKANTASKSQSNTKSKIHKKTKRFMGRVKSRKKGKKYKGKCPAF